MLKIRLRRQGAKFQPHYRVVVADSRSPRDGRFVSIVGYYDPRTNPSTINLDAAQIADWVRKGAQPTDAVIRLMKQAGVGADIVAKLESKGKATAATAAATDGGADATAATGVATATAPAATTAETMTVVAPMASTTPTDTGLAG